MADSAIPAKQIVLQDCLVRSGGVPNESHTNSFNEAVRTDASQSGESKGRLPHRQAKVTTNSMWSSFLQSRRLPIRGIHQFVPFYFSIRLKVIIMQKYCLRLISPPRPGSWNLQVRERVWREQKIEKFKSASELFQRWEERSSRMLFNLENLNKNLKKASQNFKHNETATESDRTLSCKKLTGHFWKAFG